MPKASGLPAVKTTPAKPAPNTAAVLTAVTGRAPVDLGEHASRADPRQLGRVTVTLGPDHTWYLDQLAGRMSAETRLPRKKAPERSTIIRAFIEAMRDTGLELPACRSEAELLDYFTDLLSGKRK